jgi:hypothetical protein
MPIKSSMRKSTITQADLNEGSGVADGACG